MTISGVVSHETRVTLTAVGPLGAAAGDIGVIDVSGPFAFRWNGTYLNGVPAALGVYTSIIARGEGGTNPVSNSSPPTRKTGPVSIIRRPPNSLKLLTSFPVTTQKPKWNPQAGPLRLDFSISSPGVVELDVAQGSTCPITTSAQTISSPSLNSGTHQLSWDGMIGTILGGGWAPPGNYVVELTAAFANGQPNFLPNPCVKVEVIPSPPLELAVEHSPSVPSVGEAVTVTATAMDAEHNDRLTGRVEIWAADVAEVRSHRPPSTPVHVCDQATLCSFAIPTLTQTTGQFAYRAVARDIDGRPFQETPWRMAEAIDPQAIGTNAIVMAGVPMDMRVGSSEDFGKFNQGKTKDVVFFPGDFHMFPDSVGPTLFRGIVGDHIKQLWGLGPEQRFPSTFLANQDNISFWVALKSVPITLNSTKPLNERDCGLTAPVPSWSEVNAIIHLAPCRDIALRGYKLYSANRPRNGWHEMHHIAFGLADEYCCDGGYSTVTPFPNVYASRADCLTDPMSSSPMTCLPIRERGIRSSQGGVQTCVQGSTQSPQGWRIDAATNAITNCNQDVMIENSFELEADRRRGDWVFSECDLGKC